MCALLSAILGPDKRKLFWRSTKKKTKYTNCHNITYKKHLSYVTCTFRCHCPRQHLGIFTKTIDHLYYKEQIKNPFVNLQSDQCLFKKPLWPNQNYWLTPHRTYPLNLIPQSAAYFKILVNTTEHRVLSILILPVDETCWILTWQQKNKMFIQCYVLDPLSSI